MIQCAMGEILAKGPEHLSITFLLNQYLQVKYHMLYNISKKLTLLILVALYCRHFHDGQKPKPNPTTHPKRFKLLLDLLLQKQRCLTSILS